MVDATSFLTVMAAMSAAVQTLMEHVVKKNWRWLDEKKKDTAADNRRWVTVHLLSFLLGGALAYSISLRPLDYLAVQQGIFANAIAAGVLVSFGGSVFNEALGAIREFKKAQTRIKQPDGSEEG